MTEMLGILVLLVEDNPESRDATLADITRLLPGAEVITAADTESALAILADQAFDLAVCDLRLPARPGELTLTEDNGLEVVSTLRANHGGTAVIILSGYGTISNTDRHTSGAEVLSAFGVDALPMCQAADKADLDSFPPRLERISEGLAALSAFEIECDSELDPYLSRAIAQFAVSRRFAHARVRNAGGLSGSKNAIVTLHDEGRPNMRVFVKVDSREWVLDEVRRRREYVEGFLNSASYADTLEVMRAGLRDRAGYFSSLAADAVSLFDLASSDERAAEMAVDRIEVGLAPWVLQTSVEQSVGDLRRKHLSDDLALRLGIDLDEFAEVENFQLTISHAVAHGDLHGENVLIVEDSRPVLVDFAYTEPGPAVLDPVTLEMSFVFHPASPLRRAPEGTVNFERWADGDYLVGTQLGGIVARCRQWALRGRTTAEFLALSYAHALRHVKHSETVQPKHALAVARSAARGLLS